MNGYALLTLVFLILLIALGITALIFEHKAYEKGKDEGYKEGSQPTKAELYNRRILDKEHEELRRKP